MIERLGKYQIEAQIGRGGMGAVYRARDPLLKRQVALKVISENIDVSDELRARFFREAQACAQLSHPNIITIYDLGEDEGRLFIVMEYLEGEELKQIITQRRDLPLENKLALMMQVCDGLAYAHDKGIVHRDVKPGNVFILRSGTAKVLDFGVARLVSASDDLTRAGFIMGTLRYMPPEQVRGRVDQRSDMFSAGAVFYELMAYRAPLTADDPMAILEELNSSAAPSIFQPDPAIPTDLAAVIERALRKNPDERFRNMAEMREALEAVRVRLAGEAAGLRRRLETRVAEARELQGQLFEQVGGEVALEPSPVPGERAPVVALEAALRDSEENLARLQRRVLRARALRPEYERAKGQMRFGQWDVAAEALESIVGQMPEHAGAQAELARARAEILEAGEARRGEREAAESAQQLMQELRGRAAPAAAVEDQEGPWSSAEASRAAGLLALDHQNFASARELFDTAAEQYRTAAEALDRRVQQLLGDARRRLEQRRFEECLPLVNEILALIPDHPEAAALRGEAHDGVRAEAERRAAFEQRVDAARRELAAGHLQEAIDALTTLMEEDADHARARQLLGDARAQLAEDQARAERLRAEEEARAQRLRAEAEALAQRLQADEEARARLLAEAQARQAAEEARARLAAEEALAQRLLAEAQARQAAEEARARLAAEEEARAQRLRAEAQARARLAEEEARARLAQEEARAASALAEREPRASSLDQTVLVPADEATVFALPGLEEPRTPPSAPTANGAPMTREVVESPPVEPGLSEPEPERGAPRQDTGDVEPARPSRLRRRPLLLAAGGILIIAAAAVIWVSAFLLPSFRQQREVNQARQHVVATRDEAVKARANDLAPDLMAGAEAKAREGEQLAEARRPEEALVALRDAASRYEAAGLAAKVKAEEAGRAAKVKAEEQAKADDARAAMLAEKGRAAPDTKEFQQGLAREGEGGAQYSQSAFRDAAESFRVAERLFATARPPAVEKTIPPTPAPTPPSTPPVSVSDAEIRTTLRFYVRAYETKDPGLLQQVWPGIPPAELARIQAVFEQARSIRMTLKIVGPIKVNGNEAEATGRREHVMVTNSNETVPSNAVELRFRFKRSNNRWAIASIAR